MTILSIPPIDQGEVTIQVKLSDELYNDVKDLADQHHYEEPSELAEALIGFSMTMIMNGYVELEVEAAASH